MEIRRRLREPSEMLIVQSSALKSLSLNLLPLLWDLCLIYRLEIVGMCEFTLD